MPPKEGTVPQGAVSIAVAIIWLLFMAVMVTGYVIMLISWWRAMKAHEKIADKLTEIANKFPGK